MIIFKKLLATLCIFTMIIFTQAKPLNQSSANIIAIATASLVGGFAGAGTQWYTNRQGNSSLVVSGLTGTSTSIITYLLLYTLLRDDTKSPQNLEKALRLKKALRALEEQQAQAVEDDLF